MKAKITIYDSAEGYDLASADYDKKEAYLNSFEKDWWDYDLTDLSEKDVLDVGAGTGRLSVTLLRRGAKVTALDVSAKMLERLHKKGPAINIVEGDAENLPFESESFDLITAAFVVVHLKDPAIFFKEAERVLRPGGLLIITNINQKEAPSVKTSVGQIKIKSYYHRPEMILELLESARFKFVKEKIIKEGGNWINQIVTAQK
ncbi:MAG: Methyltransferase type 11 [Parcubacteria group bacterium GW2011_GWC2_39_14]|nr:MAG: Methyltransferase type 11 [Parcubacteria group bacterium GW2011_GWC2_39_14]KKR55067.1 MAG: Methyltransferase type 11 [Parcubacteria group bacterium GW2011_GWA2_40_23]